MLVGPASLGLVAFFSLAWSTPFVVQVLYYTTTVQYTLATKHASFPPTARNEAADDPPSSNRPPRLLASLETYIPA